MNYNPDWREEDMQRVVEMDRWYQLDKRYLKSHKYHGLFTGLAQKGKKLDSKYELEQRIAKAYERIKRKSNPH